MLEGDLTYSDEKRQFKKFDVGSAKIQQSNSKKILKLHLVLFLSSWVNSVGVAILKCNVMLFCISIASAFFASILIV